MILEIELAVERRLGDPLIKIIVDDYMTLTDGPAQDSYTFDFSIPDGNHTLPPSILPNLYLGHNGAWHLDFGSPASSWLVDKRKPRLGYIAKVWKTNDEVLVAAKDFFKDLPDV